jgi:hypothetical protein
MDSQHTANKTLRFLKLVEIQNQPCVDDGGVPSNLARITMRHTWRRGFSIRDMHGLHFCGKGEGKWSVTLRVLFVDLLHQYQIMESNLAYICRYYNTPVDTVNST